MTNFLDDLWERRIKNRFPQFQAADSNDDQTHTHHALVTVLLFGTVITAISVWWLGLDRALTLGFVGGVTFYFLRELITRLQLGFRYKPWDGVMDVLEPIVWTFPVIFGSVKLLWGLALIYAVMYFWLRPVNRG